MGQQWQQQGQQNCSVQTQFPIERVHYLSLFLFLTRPPATSTIFLPASYIDFVRSYLLHFLNIRALYFCRKDTNLVHCSEFLNFHRINMIFLQFCLKKSVYPFYHSYRYNTRLSKHCGGVNKDRVFIVLEDLYILTRKRGGLIRLHFIWGLFTSWTQILRDCPHLSALTQERLLSQIISPVMMLRCFQLTPALCVTTVTRFILLL